MSLCVRFDRMFDLEKSVGGMERVEVKDGVTSKGTVHSTTVQKYM